MKLPSRVIERCCFYIGFAVLSVAAAAIVLEAGASTVFFIAHWFRSSPANLAGGDAEYAKYPWAQDLGSEEKRRLDSMPRRYRSFRVWGLREWHGKYMNNDLTDMGVVRRTINPVSSACQGKAKSAIWILGGSTIYGVKVPDSDTLPSYLSRDLNAEGNCVEVTNLGVEGYVSSQELIVLLDELKSGRHPDIVIFYDGVNDSYVTTVEWQDAGNHMGLAFIRARAEGSIWGRLDFLTYSSKAVELAMKITRRIQGGRPHERPSDSGSTPRATVDNFQRNLQVAKALGESYNFKVYGVWQPIVVFGNKPLTPFEKYLADHTADNSETPYQAMIPVYQEAQRRAATTGEFLFLGTVFDSVEDPVYLDCVHLSPRGNEIAAHAVAQYIRDHSARSND